jgi:hypothetical protein
MIQQQNQELINPTWLYIKQHTVTGLKYFGKTTRNPEKYKGSGKRWINHLVVHGNSVKTIWSQLFTDRTELVEFALNFSKENNIVESAEWANLMPENGLDGGSPKGTNKGRPCSEQARHNLDNGRKNRIYTPMSLEAKEKLRNSKLGKQVSADTKEKLKIARAKQFASNDIRYKIINPDGRMYILNRLEIKQCCAKNNLTYASLLAKGKQGKLYKGWKATLIIN